MGKVKDSYLFLGFLGLLGVILGYYIIDADKESKNKMLWKIFWIGVIVWIVIPVILYFMGTSIYFRSTANVP